jgi:hypothetical protein
LSGFPRYSVIQGVISPVGETRRMPCHWSPSSATYSVPSGWKASPAGMPPVLANSVTVPPGAAGDRRRMLLLSQLTKKSEPSR